MWKDACEFIPGDTVVLATAYRESDKKYLNVPGTVMETERGNYGWTVRIKFSDGYTTGPLHHRVQPYNMNNYKALSRLRRDS